MTGDFVINNSENAQVQTVRAVLGARVANYAAIKWITLFNAKQYMGLALIESSLRVFSG